MRADSFFPLHSRVHPLACLICFPASAYRLCWHCVLLVFSSHSRISVIRTTLSGRGLYTTGAVHLRAAGGVAACVWRMWRRRRDVVSNLRLEPRRCHVCGVPALRPTLAQRRATHSLWYATATYWQPISIGAACRAARWHRVPCCPCAVCAAGRSGGSERATLRPAGIRAASHATLRAAAVWSTTV